MKFNQFAKVSTIVIGFACVAIASAQVEKPLTVRVGAFLPSDATSSDLGKTWTAVGIDFKVAGFALNSKENNGFFSVSADYFAKNDWRSIPVTINYNIVDGKLSYFVGAGVSSTKFAIGAEKTVAAGTVGASYDLGTFFNRDFSFTAKYFLASRSEFNGFGFYLGTKF